MAESKKYIFVVVDRDYTPKLPKKFNVSAYPSFLVLNPQREEVHRFQAYMKPEPFLEQLDEGLRRYGLYKAGKVFDEPDPRPGKLSDVVAYTTRKAPSDKRPAGLAFVGGDMWVGTMYELFQVDVASNSVKHRMKMKEIISDIATDGKLLYALEGGWTAGKPIHVIDPATATAVRDIVTAANAKSKYYAAHGIAWVGGKLFVVDNGSAKILELDPQTGDITRTIKIKERFISGLSFDGENFVGGTRTGLVFINPQTGETVRKVTLNYGLRSVESAHGDYYVMEQPVMGYTKNHKWVQVWPRETRIYELQLPAAAASDTAVVH